MTYRLRRKLTAWLGLIAMCLVAFAPTASHFVRAQRVVAVPICTPDGMHTVRLDAAEHAMPDGHADTGSHLLQDCGYCDLFNHTPAIATLPPAPAAPLLLSFAVFVLPALTRFTPFGAFPSGRPRAPPAIS